VKPDGSQISPTSFSTPPEGAVIDEGEVYSDANLNSKYLTDVLFISEEEPVETHRLLGGENNGGDEDLSSAKAVETDRLLGDDDNGGDEDLTTAEAEVTKGFDEEMNQLKFGAGLSNVYNGDSGECFILYLFQLIFLCMTNYSIYLFIQLSSFDNPETN